MEFRAEISNASEVSKPQAYTPPARLEMSMTQLPNGTCYVRVAPANAAGGCNGTLPVTKYGYSNADATSASPMSVMGSRNDGLQTPLAGFDATTPMKPRVETSNANEIPNPRAYTPPPRLEMSMTKLPDGTCCYQRVVPVTASTGVKDRVQSVKLQGTKKQGLRNYRWLMASCTAENPAVPSPEVVSPVEVMGSGDDGSLGDVDPVGTVTPLTAIHALGSRLMNVTPYVINIEVGQDISSIFGLVCQEGHISVLSANGAVSQVALRQAATSGGPIIYEGRFQILQLSGLLSEAGGLRVLPAGRNCQVFGGQLAGVLTAASPVEVIVGRLAADELGSLSASSQSQ